MSQHTYVYRVQMTCDGCSGAVQRVLDKHKDKGIMKVDISLEKQTVTVLTTLSSQEVLELIKKTGKSVELIDN